MEKERVKTISQCRR